MRLPSLLISYVYLKKYLEHQPRYRYERWAMDSGAFSALNSGVEIRLQDYIDCCKKLLVSDKTLAEVYALDVIGDSKQSTLNTEEMWRQGVEAIPCFHMGEPWGLLKDLAAQYPKVAIGGCARQPAKTKDKFAGQCFARVWPKKLHGFGFGTEKSLLSFPWHSVDATSWELRPLGFGTWASLGHSVYGRTYLDTRGGSNQNLRGEILWHLDLESRAREKWKKQMTEIGCAGEHPRLYLGLGYIRETSIKFFEELV